MTPSMRVADPELLNEVIRDKRERLNGMQSDGGTDERRKLRQEIRELEARLRYLSGSGDRSEKGARKGREGAQEVFEIPWSDVRFGDGLIRLRIAGKEYSMGRRDVRQSFNAIKRAFIRRLPRLRVVLAEEKVRFPSDEEHVLFNDVLRFLKFRNTFCAPDPEVRIPVRDFIGGFSGGALPGIFFPKDKSPYLEHLCRIQSERHVIVPLIERMSHNSSSEEEDAFLFTVEAGDALYVIWENVNPNRATYVFCLSEAAYMERLQLIFDYALSDRINKRECLRQDLASGRRLGLSCIVPHTDRAEWAGKLPGGKRISASE